MLANFFNSSEINGSYQLSFSYRANEAYRRGLEARAVCDFAVYPLRFPELGGLWKTQKRLTNRASVFMTAIARQVLHYPLFLYEVIVLFLLLRKVSPDILHINNGGYPAALSARAAAVAGKWAGVGRILMVVNNLAVPYDRPSRWLDFPLDRLVANAVDVFITGSSAASARLTDVLNLPSSKRLAIHNGIRVRAGSETVGETRDRLGLTCFPGVVFGVVALLEPRKGHRVLLDAVAMLHQSQSLTTQVRFLIEGHGPLRDELEAFATHLGVTQLVKFIGDEDNVVNFMNCLDVLVLPSIRDEDFPNVILEAMALGKPVIASRLAGIPEQVSMDVNGFLVEPGNARELSDAIGKLTANPSVRQTMGRASSQRFNDHFSSDIALKNYNKLYSSLLN